MVAPVHGVHDRSGGDALTIDLDALEKVALRMARKNWDDDDSQAFDDAFRPAVALQLVRDLRRAQTNERHNREAWGKAEAHVAILLGALKHAKAVLNSHSQTEWGEPYADRLIDDAIARAEVQQ